MSEREYLSRRAEALYMLTLFPSWLASLHQSSLLFRIARVIHWADAEHSRQTYNYFEQRSAIYSSESVISGRNSVLRTLYK